MDVWIEFGDTGKEARLELDQVPRTGDRVLWLATVTEEGRDYDTETGYRVGSVEWVLGGDGEPHVSLHLVRDEVEQPAEN